MRSDRRPRGMFKHRRATADVLRMSPTPDAPSPMSEAKRGSTGMTHPKPRLLMNWEPVRMATVFFRSYPPPLSTLFDDEETLLLSLSPRLSVSLSLLLSKEDENRTPPPRSPEPPSHQRTVGSAGRRARPARCLRPRKPMEGSRNATSVQKPAPRSEIILRLMGGPDTAPDEESGRSARPRPSPARGSGSRRGNEVARGSRGVGRGRAFLASTSGLTSRVAIMC